MGIPNMGRAQGQIDQHLSSLAEIERVLLLILNEGRSDPALLAIGDVSMDLTVTKEFPYPGATRVIVPRTGEGANVPLAGSGLIFTSNPNRLGGSIVNKAAAGVTLILSDQARTGAPSVWVGPNGGSWDFRLSGFVWCGNVFAVPDSGNLSLAGASV